MKIKPILYAASALWLALATTRISCPPAFAADRPLTPTPLESALKQWNEGQKESAVKAFLQIDWTKGPAFSPKSPLAARENDLPAMSAATREKLMGEVMLSLKNLKQLAAAVKEKGVAGGNPALEKQCREKLEQCGKALNQPGSLKILQLTAQSIGKMAAASQK